MRRGTPIAGIVMALAVSAAAQTPATEQPSSIAGTVTNAITGEPVLRAHVVVQCPSSGPAPSMPSYGALSNAKGEFTVTKLPSGNCTLRADRVGFVPSAGNNSYELTSGTHREGVKVTLTPAGSITGRVLDSSGEPVSGAIVGLEIGGRMGMSATTDDQGRYRLGGLQAGKYRVKATPQALPFPPEIRSDGTTETHDAAAYYPGVLDAKTAQKVEVKAGAEAGATDIRLVRTPIVIVSGKVTGIPAGVKNVMVMAQGAQGSGPVKPDGTFVMYRVDPGKYTLSAQAWGQSPLRSAPLEVEVGTANLEHLELRIVPAFEVSGQVRFDDEKARQQPKPPTRPDGTAAPLPPPPPHKITLRPIQEQFGDSPSAAAEADDSFVLAKVQPGRYRVTINWGAGYVKSVRVGMTETDGDVLDVRNGSAGAVTVSVSSNFCEISGTVSDAKGPAANATVVLEPDEGSVGGARMGRTDSTGSYKFRTGPGKYKLAAVDETEFSMGYGSRTLDGYEDVTVALDLSAGDKVTKDLKRR